jgi:hypothetical protein
MQTLREIDFPELFGLRGACDIRAICETDRGVYVVRHDGAFLTVEDWDAPP